MTLTIRQLLGCGGALAVLVAGLATASGAHAQGTRISTTDTYTESLVFNPATTTTTNVTNYSTQILGRLNGGTPLYDQTFPVPFSDPAAQAGVVAARAAITTAGGPGVIIGAPVLTASSNNTTSASTTTYSLASTQTTIGTPVINFGPGTITTGQLSQCNVSGLPGSTRPTCQNLPGTPYVLADGETNFNTNTNTAYTIDEATATTNTTTLFEQWTLFGYVQAFGLAHTAVQSGALDAGSRFLRRMGDAAFADDAPAPGIRMWAEGYGVWSKARASGGIPGDDRSQYGFAAGLAGNLTPNFTLGLGIDHGNTNVRLDNGFERGDIRLTQFGLYGGYTAGPWFANLAGTFGVGEVNTQNNLLGLTTARYDLTTAGVLGEAGYRMQLGDWRVTPSLGFDYTMVRSDGFTETGTLALTAPARTAGRTRLWAGLDAGQRLGAFDWSVYGRLVGVVSGDERLLPVTFYNLPMTVTGNKEAKLGGDAGARFAWRFAPGAELFARYDGRFRDGFTAHAASAGLKVRF
ncbi:MAG: autotransporter outer membrane beta-barrel domain-containing protein [Novosphingobium sp.]